MWLCFSDPLFLQQQMQLSLILENFIKTTFCKVPQYFSVEEHFVIINFTCFWWRIKRKAKTQKLNFPFYCETFHLKMTFKHGCATLWYVAWVGSTWVDWIELLNLVFRFYNCCFDYDLNSLLLFVLLIFLLLKCCFLLPSAPYFCDFLIVVVFPLLTHLHPHLVLFSYCLLVFCLIFLLLFLFWFISLILLLMFYLSPHSSAPALGLRVLCFSVGACFVSLLLLLLLLFIFLVLCCCFISLLLLLFLLLLLLFSLCLLTHLQPHLVTDMLLRVRRMVEPSENKNYSLLWLGKWGWDDQMCYLEPCI